MTTGQVLFYSGLGLLALTVILAIVFHLKRPKYIPENAAYDGTGDRTTRKLRSGYPTDRLTIRREPERSAMPGTMVLHEETEQLSAEQTEVLPGTAVLQETEVLGESTEPLDAQLTERLEGGTAPLTTETTSLTKAEGTVPLSTTGETAVLTHGEETAGGTTPL